MSLASVSEDPPSLEQYGYREILPMFYWMKMK